MNKNITKLLSVMLVAVMIVLMIPFATSAASDAEQITSLDQLTTGKYVIVTVASNVAMDKFDGSSWVLTQSVTPTNGKLTGVNDTAVWTITVVSEGSVKLTDCNGVTVAPKGGNDNGIKSGSYNWKVTCANGKFQFCGVGNDTVRLASNKSSAGKFRAYKNTSASGSAGGFPSDFYVYKVGGTGSTPVETTPVTTTAPVTTAAPVTTKAPETTAAPVVPETPATNGVVLSVDTLGLASDSYAEGTATIGGTSFEYIQMGNYGDGLQMRDKNNNPSRIWNTTAFAKPIAKIELVYSDTKSTYDNPNAVIFTFGNEAQGAAYTTKLSTAAGVKTYTITPDAETYKFFKLEHDLDYSMYWKSITIVFADGTTETTVAAPDTTAAAPETTVAAPETTVAAPETTVAAPETTVAAPETTVAAPETTAPSNPSTGDASFVIIAMAALAGVAVAFIVSKKKVRA